MRNRYQLILVCLSLLVVTSVGHAKELDMKKEPAFKKALKWRDGRSEVGVLTGVTTNDAYFRNHFFLLSFNQHVSNWLSFGAKLGYSLPVQTNLAQNIESEIAKRYKSQSDSQKFYSLRATHIGAIGEAFMQIAPISGKTMLLGSSVVAFDFHFSIGVALMQSLWNNASGADSGDQTFEAELLVAPALGAGLRMFLASNLALNVDLIDYFSKMHTHADEQGVIQPASWRHNIAVTLGFSVLFPGRIGHE